MKGQPFKKIAGVLKGIAPMALTALGGPAGAAAATIMKKTMGIEGTSDETLAKTIENAMQTPEGLQKLRQIEVDLEKAQMQMGIRFEELATENTEGARQMAMATTLKPQMIIAGLYLGGYFATLGYMLYLAANGVSLETGIGELIKTLLTAFSVGVPIILQFFFGSSAGSKMKDVATFK